MSRRFEEHTREELRRSAADMLVVLPVGATEQHGPHLPVGVDSYAVTHIAHAAVKAIGAEIPVVVTPTLPFGSSPHHLPFGGTLSLGTETYYRVLCDLAESLITGGFRMIFFLNGHGGNNELIQLVARDLALKHPAHLGAASYWTIAWDGLIAEQAHSLGGLPGHAGVFESALMLALRPELVREPRPHRATPATADPRGLARYRSELHGAWQRTDGYTDSPDQARADLGERYLATIVREVSRALVEFYREAQAASG